MPQPQKYVSKPVVVEAMQLTSQSRPDILRWLGKSNYVERSFDPVNVLIINEHGNVMAELNDWIIKGTRGEFYPCKNSTFQEKYQLAGAAK